MFEAIWPQLAVRLNNVFEDNVLPEAQDPNNWIPFFTENEQGYYVTIVPRPGLFEPMWESDNTLAAIKEVLTDGQRDTTKSALLRSIQQEQRELFLECLGQRVELNIYRSSDLLTEPEVTEVEPEPQPVLEANKPDPVATTQKHPEPEKVKKPKKKGKKIRPQKVSKNRIKARPSAGLSTPKPALEWNAIKQIPLLEPSIFEGTKEAFRDHCTLLYSEFTNGPARAMLLECGEGMRHPVGPKSTSWISKFDLDTRTEACADMRGKYTAFLALRHVESTQTPRNASLEGDRIVSTQALELLILKTAFDNQEWDYIFYFLKTLSQNSEKTGSAENYVSILLHLGKLIGMANGLKSENSGDYSVTSIKKVVFKMVATICRELIPEMAQHYKKMSADDRITLVQKIGPPAKLSEEDWALLEGKTAIEGHRIIFRLHRIVLLLMTLNAKPGSTTNFAQTYLGSELDENEQAKINRFVNSKKYAPNTRKQQDVDKTKTKTSIPL